MAKEYLLETTGTLSGDNRIYQFLIVYTDGTNEAQNVMGNAREFKKTCQVLKYT